MGFPLTFFIIWLTLIQKNTYGKRSRDRGKPQIQIL